MALHRFLVWLCGRFGLHHPTLATAIITLGSGMMNTVFMFYYVKVFLNRYHIVESWFQISQILFLVWNAVNDPLFGYLQDVGDSWMRRRKLCIKYGALFFVISFLVPWFAPWIGEGSPPWVVGLHLIISLFLYDGMFSFVLLAFCALFAELTTDPKERVRFARYSSFFGLLSSAAIFFVDRASSSVSDFFSFQLCCVAISVFAYFCISYTGSYAPDKAAQLTDSKLLQVFTACSDVEEQDENEAGCSNSSNSVGRSSGNNSDANRRANSNNNNCSSRQLADKEEPWPERWRLSKEVLRNKDFHCLVWTNFFHICRSTALANFSAILVESIVPSEIVAVGTTKLSLFYGVVSVTPQLLFISGSFLADKYGPYKLFRFSLVASVLNGILMLCIGRQAPLFFLLFIFVDSILVYSISPLFSVLFPDMIDEDMQMHKRQSPISSIIFSLNALFTKPAQSLSPMLVVFVFNLFGYEAFQKKLVTEPGAREQLLDVMFYTFCLLPVVFATIELITLQRYSLRQKHSKAVSLY